MSQNINVRVNGQTYAVHFWPNGDVYSVTVLYQKTRKDLSRVLVQRTLWNDHPRAASPSKAVDLVVAAARNALNRAK